jgi:hypothetical protein
MKANEAPEKLYIDFRDRKESTWRCAYTEKAMANDIEYIRKDAFVEKACEYFRRNLEDTKVIDDYRNILVRGIQASYTSVEEFIEDFRNYIKGE